MAKVPQELIEKIKESNDIVEVVSEYIELKLMGNVYQGRCPFPHSDDGKMDYYPSFTVNPDKQFFYCFGCGKGSKENGNFGSDVIAFIREIENVDFEMACRILAERANISFNLIENTAHEQKKDKVTKKNKEYVRNLSQEEDVINYINNRGMGAKAITLGRMGYVQNDLGDKNPTEWQKLIRNRLVIGIPDMSKSRKPKTIALAYRTMQEGGIPKWINDPNSEIFQKGETLYLYSYAYRAIRKQGFALVVEGYFDALTAHENNLKNTVAIMGRIFTKKQMEILRKDTDTLFLWPDGDGPGLRWAIDSLNDLFKLGFKVFIINCPKGQDPDDIINQQGSNINQWIADNAKPAIKFVLDLYAEDYEKQVSILRSKALDILLPLVKSCPNSGQRMDAKDIIERRFSIKL